MKLVYFYQLFLVIIIINNIGSIDKLEKFDKLENIYIKEKREKDLHSNITVIYNFSNFIYSIEVVNKDNEFEVPLWIEILKNTSNSTKKIKIGKVYKYFNALIRTERIKNATIKYKVNNRWIKNNKIDNITLFIWDKEDKKWIGLYTKIIDKDNRYTYYQSKTDKLSSFVITGTRDNKNETVIAKKDINLNKVDKENEIESDKNTDNINEKKNTGYDTIILLVVLIILVIFILKSESLKTKDMDKIDNQKS